MIVIWPLDGVSARLVDQRRITLKHIKKSYSKKRGGGRARDD